MKKLLCLVLSTLMMWVCMLPVAGDQHEAESAERLMLIAKEKLSIDDNVFEFQNYSLHTTDHGNNYRFYWVSKDKNADQSIYATLSEDGIITGYSYYKPKNTDKLSFATYGTDDAIKAAGDFITSIDAEKFSQTKVTDTSRQYDGSYQITFERVKNDIPVIGNALYCTVDCDTLEIMQYTSSWSEVTFPDSAPISLEEGQQAFCDKLGHQLFYQVQSTNYENSAKLIYRSRYDEDLYIDAVSGEVVSYDELNDLYYDSTARNEAAKDSASGGMVTLSPSERAAVEQIGNMISAAEADRIVRSIDEFSVGTELEQESYDIQRIENGDYIINLYYHAETETKSQYAYVSLHAETGQITSYYYHEYDADDAKQKTETKKIAADELKRKADAFLNKYYAEEMANMVEKSYFDSALQENSFRYLRTEDGIPVYNNGAYVQYDAQTGKLTSFTLNWTKVDFPSAAMVQSLEAANRAAMEKGNFALRYMVIPNGEDGLTATLLYGLAENPILDAVTLSALDYRLRPAQEEAPAEYTDIEGHYAKDAIVKLAEYDIFLPAVENGQLCPDSCISQKNYFLLLDRMLWNGRHAADIDELFQYLIRLNILTAEEVNPQAPVKRIDGIRWLLNALNYGEFVKIPNIFRNPFGDVEEGDVGVAAVAWGLGLVKGDNGQFYPNDYLRRADALLIIYNYMNNKG